MAGDPMNHEDSPDLQAVFAELDDPACRAILSHITEPMTATDLSGVCDVPKSTLYRKLDLLSNASLVRELVDVGSDGGRITRYERDVSDVTVSIDDEGSFSVKLERPSRGMDGRLAEMWSEMGEEL